MKTTECYRITAVRLVEFHNLGTTVVDIPEGGHLFLLGDNGSGKTTLLDAVHLVLTGGREVEFNSAARVAGAKESGGRTIQGIVLRYNAVTGRAMRETGITYAAVELHSNTDKTLSLVVGFSAEGLDVAYQSWGGTASVPVRSLPLTVEDGGRLRAATQAEFKRAMTSSVTAGKYFVHIGDYRMAVANRLFGGDEKYVDVCKLLRTGKAYREIAARATNYDELFRQLLEDPQRETFEPLLKGLRELEESKGRLDQIDERARYLGDLKRRRDQLTAARQKTQVLDWAECAQEQARAEREAAACREAREAGEAEQRRLTAAWQDVRSEAERARARLDDLRQKDATGLLGREKSVAARMEDAKRKAEDAAGRLNGEAAVLRGAEKAGREARNAWVQALNKASETLQKAARAADVPAGDLTDQLFAAESAEGVSSCGAAFSGARTGVATVRDERLAAAQEARRLAIAAADRVEQAEATCAALLARSENMPTLEGFAEMQTSLRQNMLTARSVYELLEPAAGCDGRHLALLERLAGEEFLATVVADEKESDRVRQLVWHEGSQVAVAVRETCGGEVSTLAPWLGGYISFEESDPAAVALLARHLAAGTGVSDGDFLAVKTWSFRRREGLLPTGKPRLIGRKARAAELARLRREAEEARAQALREQKAAEKCAQEAEEAVRTVRTLEGELETARVEIARTAEAAQRMQERVLAAERVCVQAREIAQERKHEMQAVRDELDDIRLKMKAAGIDGSLEKRLSAAERALKAKCAEAEELLQKIGAVRGRLEGLEKSQVASEAAAKAAEEKAVALAAAFAFRASEGETVADCAARICPEITDKAAFADLRTRFAGDARVCETEIGRMIREQKGEAFSFSFDVTANRLNDRRGSGLDEVLADETRRLEELKDTINQKSREVFERIFMGEVMLRLYHDLRRIEDLAQRIQRNLAKRRFGSNRYSFALTPVPEYEGFVNLVRKGYLLDAGEEKDGLHAYLEAHREDILTAEVDQIPEIFDYRSWFRFQLKVLTENEEGRVIDRQVKSLGSGGEQAVPNYLLILTVAEFLYHGGEGSDPPKSAPMLFDEAFYGIDAARRDQLLAFADDLGLQLFVSSPDQDGVKREIRHSVSLIVVKDENLDVHLSPIVWTNVAMQGGLFEDENEQKTGMRIGEETT